jgi:hypothetical protein
MFGVAPPQTLYHTRQASPPAGSGAGPARVGSPPLSPTRKASNPNQSAYAKLRPKGKKARRPGTSESRTELLGGHDAQALEAPSEVYVYYRNSLNSLKDIIDRVCTSLCVARAC